MIDLMKIIHDLQQEIDPEARGLDPEALRAITIIFQPLTIEWISLYR